MRLGALTKSFNLAEANLTCSVQHLPNLFGRIKQKAAEGVVVAVVAEETAWGQVDVHPVPNVQLQGQDDRGAILLVMVVLLTGPGHRPAVNLQLGTGGQGVLRGTGVAVNGDGEAVDARAGSGEGARCHVVVVAQVEEHFFIDNDFVDGGAAAAFEGIAIEQGDGEGRAAGWRWREKRGQGRNRSHKKVHHCCCTCVAHLQFF